MILFMAHQQGMKVGVVALLSAARRARTRWRAFDGQTKARRFDAQTKTRAFSTRTHPP